MTTVIPFIPSNLQVPTIPVTLDSNPYNITITWNVSAQRFYINVYDLGGNWIITTPLVSSPPARNVQSAIYNPFLNIVTVQMVSPTLWPIPLSSAGLATPPGTMIDYTFEGFVPTTYNGLFRCMHIDQITFTYPMTTDPGALQITGTVNRLMNMVQSVFQTSSLVYRNGAFEVNP